MNLTEKELRSQVATLRETASNWRKQYCAEVEKNLSLCEEIVFLTKGERLWKDECAASQSHCDKLVEDRQRLGLWIKGLFDSMRREGLL